MPRKGDFGTLDARRGADRQEDLHRRRHALRQPVPPPGAARTVWPGHLSRRRDADLQPSRRAGADRLHRHHLRQAQREHRPDDGGPSASRRRGDRRPQPRQPAAGGRHCRRCRAIRRSRVSVW